MRLCLLFFFFCVCVQAPQASAAAEKFDREGFKQRIAATVQLSRTADKHQFETEGVVPLMRAVKDHSGAQSVFCQVMQTGDIDDLLMFEFAIRYGAHDLKEPCARALLARLDAIRIDTPNAPKPDCSKNPDVIGTARTIEVDFEGGPAYGTLRRGRALDLKDKELVLTFDDGPIPGRTTAILDTLDRHCVKATFFVIGRASERHSNVLIDIHNKGHTIAHHTYTHAYLTKIPLERAKWEISRGEESVQAILDAAKRPLASPWPAKVAPFFRFPGFMSSPALKAFTAENDIADFLVDVPTEDWRRISADEVYENAIKNAEKYRKGIVVMHDIQMRAIKSLPRILTEWHRRGFKIVHMVPKGWKAHSAQ